MATRPTRPRDTNQLAKLIVDLSVGDKTDPLPSKKAAAGRAGGLKGGKTRMNTLTDEERIALAKRAAAARWVKTPPNAPSGIKKRTS